MDPTKRMPTAQNKFTLEHMASMTMAAICGGGGVYSYMQNKSMPSLIAGVTLGSLYDTGYELDGHSMALIYQFVQTSEVHTVSICLVASTLLVLAMGPRAYTSRANLPVALTGVGALIMARMGYASYNLRHGVRRGGNAI